MKNCFDILLILIVCVAILIPVLCFNTLPNQVSIIENRALAEPVPLSSGLNAFMTSLENSIDDRIGFRDPLMQLYNRLYYTALSGNHASVISGSDGWLFFRDELADYTGTNLDPDKSLRNAQIITAMDQWCRERGITFVLAVGPNKSSIYGNHMPEYIRQAETSNVEATLQLLEGSGIHISFPKDALIADRESQELYCRLDTHWNVYGSRYMLQEILQMLGLPEQEFQLTPYTSKTGDLMNMLGTGWNGAYSQLAQVEPHPQASIETTEDSQMLYLNSAEGTEKIVCYRDSFHITLLDYYGYYFHGPVIWRRNIDFDFVEREAPKYLILSTVERAFDYTIESNAHILELTKS